MLTGVERDDPGHASLILSAIRKHRRLTISADAADRSRLGVRHLMPATFVVAIEGQRRRQTVFHVQLGEDAREMRLDRRLADAERLRDLVVADALSDAHQDLALAPREACQPILRPR